MEKRKSEGKQNKNPPESRPSIMISVGISKFCAADQGPYMGGKLPLLRLQKQNTAYMIYPLSH